MNLLTTKKDPSQLTPDQLDHEVRAQCFVRPVMEGPAFVAYEAFVWLPASNEFMKVSFDQRHRADNFVEKYRAKLAAHYARLACVDLGRRVAAD